MRLKNRLALVVVLFLSAFVGCYSLLLFLEVPLRAGAETNGAMPWVLRLLPGHADAELHGQAAQRQALVALVQGLEGIRHVRVVLRAPGGDWLAGTAPPAQPLPSWLSARLTPKAAVRKDVSDGDQLLAYFEVSPAIDDELAELWQDFVRAATLVTGLSLAAMLLILWFTFQSLKPLDRIRDALRAVAAGRQDARLPAFSSPEMQEIAMSFNRMADAQAASHAERQALLRKLIDSEENTRRSVAHDLHDELSPYLVALQPLVRTLQLKCAQRAEWRDLSATVDSLIGHQSHILAKLRAILMGLHPPELETLGLRGAIERLAAQPLRSDDGREIAVLLHAGGDWQAFGPTLDVSVYRLIQECLNNARRHAAGDRVEVRFDPQTRAQGRTMLAIEVVNDYFPQRSGGGGVGGGGLGLPGMRDRCLALGGSFEAGPLHGEHWRVRVQLPLDADTARTDP